MSRRAGGQVSLLVHFAPEEVRDAARGLSGLLGGLDEVTLSLDADRGNLELGNVRGVDLPLLTEWLYRRGARGLFVRYPHEGWLVTESPAAAAAPPVN